MKVKDVDFGAELLCSLDYLNKQTKKYKKYSLNRTDVHLMTPATPPATGRGTA